LLQNSHGSDSASNGSADEVYLEGNRIGKRMNMSQYEGSLQQVFP